MFLTKELVTPIFFFKFKGGKIVYLSAVSACRSYHRYTIKNIKNIIRIFSLLGKKILFINSMLKYLYREERERAIKLFCAKDEIGLLTVQLFSLRLS